jgi:pimeloyl-ACP methyl ester carboxylesterase
MNVVLVPGFWLDASSWDAVTPALVSAGHHVHAITPPGLDSLETDRSAITLQDHIDAVVAAIDAIGEPVVLIGHSGGGPTSYAAAGLRPDAVRRVVFVDAGPNAAGDPINAQLPAASGEVPLPDWSAFGEEELRDLDDRIRAEFAARAIPEPAAVARTPFSYPDDAARRVPATVICCAFTGDELREEIARGAAWASELAAVDDVEYVDLPTGHWPQFTKPAELAAILVDVVR